MSPRDDAEVERRVARIEGLIQAIEAGPDAATRDAARELSTATLDFHGVGLARIFDRLAEAGAAGRAIAEACARDALVAGLLALHDLPRQEPALVQLRLGRDAPAHAPPAPALTFEPVDLRPVPYAATPLLSLTLAIRTATPGQVVHAILLRCQVRIEPARRSYTGEERAALGDLLGELGELVQLGAPNPSDRPPSPLLWAHTGAAVPAFEGSTTVEVPLPCTYDLAVASARYFDALQGGAAPLLLLFSGTMFLERADGALTTEPIPWTQEARFALPAAVWREAMELHYPEVAPLLLRRDVFERLRRHRASLRATSWEEALAALLDAAGAP